MKQNRTMMSICLNKSSTADAQARLLTYRNKYTFDGVEYAPFMYKIIMRFVTIDSVATTQTLCNNLQSLGVLAAIVSGNIDKIHNKFHKNHSQLLARGASVDGSISILFDAYLLVPCHNFKLYNCRHDTNYLEGKLAAITHKTLMTSAKRKYDWLKTKGIWGAAFSNNKTIVAMTAALNPL